jgi:hypothetical protein
MNQAHWHLLLNHFPIIGSFLSFATLLAGMILKQPGIKRAGLGLFVLTALLCIPAFLTGEGAEKVLKSIGQNPELIGQKHERLGEIFVWTCSVAGLVALLALFIEKRRLSLFKLLCYAMLVISIGNGILLKGLGTSGGEIKHTEIRGEAFQKWMDEHKDDPIEEDDEDE